MTATPQSFVPAISQEVPWHTRQHIQLIYQKLNNHAQAIAAIKPGTTTNNITEVNSTSSSGGSSMLSGLGGVNNQSGNTAYTTQNSDGGIVLVLDDASPVAVTLNAGVSVPWFLFATNLGAGLVTFTPTTGTINGGATFALPFDYTSVIAFDGTNWFATGLPVVPATHTAVAHQFLTGYNATTGLFTAAQPAFTDISGTLAAAQLPAAGISTTIVTAQLTTLGAQGSMTFVDGLLTASTPAT